MTHVLKLIFYILLILITSFSVKAECNFNNSEYLKELSNPKNIKKINIEVPKSSKYIINFYKILGSKSENIPPELRRAFRAILKVDYKFGGSCTYKAKIRQNGDWRDHIDEESGLRSLKVNLKDGNILNSTKFKLLLPVTRGNLNEILGTIILNELGFISPDTFQVNVEINGSKGLMLFQEDAQKELLEKNQRTEGPIFEGDESLLWSRNKSTREYEEVLLARMVNQKWFNKNENSKKITLSSFANLQEKYLEYSRNIPLFKKILIFPNNKKSNIFEDYLFIMLSMNGKHGLRPHNRKYYFNSFENKFEPIYYDGGLNLINEITVSENIIKYGFKENYVFKKIKLFNDEKFINKLFKYFNDRILYSNDDTKRFFKTSIAQIIENIKKLQKKINEFDYNNNQIIIDNINKDYVTSYLESLKKLNLIQNNIGSIIEKKDKFKISLIDQPNHSYLVDKNNLIEIISNNNYQGKRFVLLTHNKDYRNIKIDDLIKIKKFDGMIIHSQGINLDISPSKKIIHIKQTDPMDWILFKNTNLSNWSIFFEGRLNKNDSDIKKTQFSRFNSHGLTGCLTLYKSRIYNSNFYLENGSCEDILNINNSFGQINKVIINNALYDAIDLDFSDINLDYVNISKAGNDCVDLSSGKYFIKNLILSECQDKGVSVGEKSNFIASEAYIKNSDIGISSKDESISKIQNAKFNNVKYCFEVEKKKQEFGGAKILFNSIFCEANFIKDKNSSVNISIK
jgi:hypothetical protein